MKKGLLEDHLVQPRSQGLSSSHPLEREREGVSLSRSRGWEEERPWERGCVKGVGNKQRLEKVNYFSL